MAITQQVLAVGTTPVLLATGRSTAYLQPGGGALFVGNSAVTTATGVNPQFTGGSIPLPSFTLGPREELYGVADTTIVVRVLVIGD